MIIYCNAGVWVCRLICPPFCAGLWRLLLWISIGYFLLIRKCATAHQVSRRDCPRYQVRTPSGAASHELLNHLKSQSGKGGDGDKRKGQGTEVRKIVKGLVVQGQHVVVLGDLNEGPKGAGAKAANLSVLYYNNGPLVECYSRAKFEGGKRPGTFDSHGWTNQLEPISTTEFMASGHSNLESATLNLESVLGRPLRQRQDPSGQVDRIPGNPQLLGEEASDHAAV
jgi:hypothetical protein